MDLKSFYKKIDVDSIKNKLPPLKIPKIKSRKIFKSSREDLAQQQSSSGEAMGIGSPVTPQSLPGRTSSFIDRTPTRISTVSSLMNINYGFKDKPDIAGQSTYKTAKHFEEENCPDEFDTREQVSGSSVSRFSDKCKKTYKDFSEFKIKSLFVKKTVVRRTEIEVDIYARQYERDNYLEQRELENEIEDNDYKFEFKEARRRRSGSSGTISPPDSLRSGVPSPIRSELGHLQQNDTPPLLAKRRNAITQGDGLRQKLHRSMSSGSNDEPQAKPNRSSLWGLNDHSYVDSGEEQVQVHRPYETRLSRFKKSMKEGIRESMSADSGEDRPRLGFSRGKVRRPRKEESSDSRNMSEEPSEDQPTAHKMGRMARLKKSMKDGIPEGFMERIVPVDSGEDQPSTAPKAGPSRMARFKKSMKDGISEGFSDRHPSFETGDEQPREHKTTISRMARFKQSMKAGVSESALDKNIPGESGDEQTHAPQKGISRMAKFKKSMREGISSRNIPAESGDEPSSTLPRISRKKASPTDKNTPQTESGEDQPRPMESRMSRFKKSMKEGMTHEFDSTWNLKGIRNRFTSDETEHKSKKNAQSQESLDEHSDHEKKTWKLKNIHLRRSEPSDKNNDPVMSSPDGKFSNIKMSLNRLKNRRPQKQTSEESETDHNAESPKQNMSDQLKAGLRRLKMGDRSLSFDEDNVETKPPKEPTNSNRFRNWKKSIKLIRHNAAVSEDTGEEPPPLPTSSPPVRSLTLMRKLNHIRSRKNVSEDVDDSADPSHSNEQSKQKSSNLDKFEHARTKAMKRVNAQVQKMKNFHGKSKDSPSEATPEKEVRKTTKENISKPLPIVLSSHSLESALSLDDDEEIPPVLPEKGARKAIKSRHPIGIISSRSMDELSLEDEDNDSDEPRVFLHQDSSDQFESTLTVAVSRPAPPLPPTAVIREIIPKTKYQAPKTEWIPNKNAISTFLEITPTPSPEPMAPQIDINRGHLRKRSMDSNDSDSWIPDNFRNKTCSSSSIAALDKINENSEPWKVHSVFSAEKLYKTKSIDIFVNRDGNAFTDFDDEMKNVPVRRIISDRVESLDKGYGDSSDEEVNGNIRVNKESPVVSTKVAIESIHSANSCESTESNKAYRGSPVPNKKAARIGNSKESLDANFDENDEISSEEEEDEDDDAPPMMAPSPPPSFSPPPPPLPLRKPPRLLPERNDSMVRLAHPLVKQGSLRRHFSEELEPSDLGKVNKLITKFEKTPTYENVPRIQLISDDDSEVFPLEDLKAVKTTDNDTSKISIQYSSNNNVDYESFEVEDKNKTPTKDNINNKKTSRTGSTDEEGNFEEKKKITRTNTKRRPAPIPIPVISSNISNDNDNDNFRKLREHQRTPSPDSNENLDNVSIQSPNSIYGSPIGSICLSERISTSSIYGSPVGSSYQTKTADQLRLNKRRLSNRSSLRDDDTFYSFESDEENNFYSLGDSTELRYTIEI